MNRITTRSVRITLAIAAALALGATIGVAGDDWTQWGGSNRFRAQSSSLAAKWPDDGPPKLWTRDLGEGYSAILYDGGKLYTMYRDGDHEIVVALDAKNGKTVWEHKYAASPGEDHVHQFGDGPRSTPLISGKTIYTIGVAGHMHALNKSSGKVLWSHDLWDEKFGGSFLNHGYSSSPIAYKNSVIVLVGGENGAIVAFGKKKGDVLWQAGEFTNSYSSPTVLTVDGKDQLVTFMANDMVGMDPVTGAVEWTYAHENQWGQNVNQPVMADENHMFLSSPQAGAKGLKLTRNGDKTDVEEIWSTRKIQFYHVTSVRDGEYVYGSTGTMGPAFMAAVNIKTGEIAWRERGLAKANLVWADGRLIILDEDGKLALAAATPEGFELLSEVELLEKVAWTVPTVVGTTLYVRDKTTIMALDLG